MPSHLTSALRSVDRALTQTQLSFVGETNALITLLFHTVFDGVAEENSNVVHPDLGIQLEDFRRVIQHYVASGYQFVEPDQIVSGLPAGRFCLITFDDGYYNNVRVLPVLEEFRIPALFFISSNHVIENRSYWWDAVYRSTFQSGSPSELVEAEFKRWRHDQIEEEVTKRYGSDALTPINELDRPLSPQELTDFAAHEFVHIGNHTADHALLTRYDEAGVRQQISKAQQDIREMTGMVPEFLSYPNGFYDDQICRIASEEGLKVGITADPRKNPLPMSRSKLQWMKLGRFMPDRTAPIEEQCTNIRSDVRLIRRIKAVRNRLNKVGH